jgi:SAM-dependent methyltransferase
MEFLRSGPYVRDVLDAGCGGGYFLERLKKAGYGVAGIDISEDALKIARSRLGDEVPLHRHRLDEAPWPIPNESFDVVWSSEVIEHVFGVHEYVAEAHRVLRKGGHLILTTPFHGLVKNLVVALFYFDRHFNNIEGGHIRFFTRRSLTAVVRGCGFEEVAFSTIGRIPALARSMFVVFRKRGDRAGTVLEATL